MNHARLRRFHKHLSHGLREKQREKRQVRQMRERDRERERRVELSAQGHSIKNFGSLDFNALSQNLL